MASSCSSFSNKKKRERETGGGPLQKSAVFNLILVLVLHEEQERQEEEDLEREYRQERERFEEDHRRRRELLLEQYRSLQEEFAEWQDLARCRAKRARMAVSALGSAISTQQGVQRRLWVKARSHAWWDSCNNPGVFPDADFRRAFRMSRATLERVCVDLGAAVAKEDTMLRQAIPVRQRVAVCVWRLATGEPLREVSKRFGLGISTCHKLVLEVCSAIKDLLLPKYIQWPTMISDRISASIPNIAGAMYTTHIPIIAPKENVAAYFNKRHTERNQKTSYSIAVQGVVNARGCFTDVFIGCPGSWADHQILEKSKLYHRGFCGCLNGTWVVGGAGYPLLDWLLVPYSHNNLTWTQHTFNGRINESLNLVKAAFGRLKGRWCFLQKRTEVKLDDLPAVLGACCVLHNICEQYREPFDPGLHYEVNDETVVPDNAMQSAASIRMRDTIAHDLLHKGHANAALF